MVRRCRCENAPDGWCASNADGTNPDGKRCVRAFYDDTGYTTAAAPGVTAAVGVPGSVLCAGVGAVPAQASSDDVDGYSSESSTARAFGTTSASNPNYGCHGPFGDAKGLDLWAYVSSDTQRASVTVAAP